MPTNWCFDAHSSSLRLLDRNPKLPLGEGDMRLCVALGADHGGLALNMVPAYVGYMTINAITGITRSWIMGQGHCVAAVDTVNLLLNNMTPAHAERYSLTELYWLSA